MIVTKIPITEITKPKVCAYVRVSTDKEAQEDSFIFQTQYWDQHFSKSTDYEYVGLYSDEGISGKAMRNRKGLNAMLEDVRKGKIDKVYTKSISRFARNYTELMTVVRELRDLNVPIIFEKENINTLDPRCGLVLSVMASLAEEELRSMSKNQQWAARKRFENGSIELTRLYGYSYKKGKLTVNPIEAAVVQEIYSLYLNGFGVVKIAQILDKKGYAPPMAGKKWCKSTICSILTNEKHKGDCLLQKNIYSLDERRVNDGELPQYYVEGSHEAIVSKQTFDDVQKLMKKRSAKFHPNSKKASTNKYPLSGKIKCGNCGASYARRTCAKGKTYECIKWSCITKEQKTKEVCNNNEIKNDIIEKLLVEAYNECIDANRLHSSVSAEEEKLQKLLAMEQELKTLHVQGYISENQYKSEMEELLRQIKCREVEIKTAKLESIDMKKYKKSVEFTKDIADFLIQATVIDWTVTFRFANGYETMRKYTNGRAGNVNGKLCKT